MVYLAESLVVMTDRLKIVRIQARNVYTAYTDTSAYDDGASLASLSVQESDSVVFSVRWGAVLLKHKKSSWDNCACLAVASKQESCRDTKSEQSDCNKSSVR